MWVAHANALHDELCPDAELVPRIGQEKSWSCMCIVLFTARVHYQRSQSELSVSAWEVVVNVEHAAAGHPPTLPQTRGRRADA